MRSYHWGMIFLLVFTGYMIGIFQPGVGNVIRAKIGF